MEQTGDDHNDTTVSEDRVTANQRADDTRRTADDERQVQPVAAREQAENSEDPAAPHGQPTGNDVSD